MANGPSPHLSWSELTCKDGTPYPQEWRSERGLFLALEFERIRAIVGVPIVVLSAYRTLEWNKLVGGAKVSQHVQGRALDLKPPEGWTVDRFYNLIHLHALALESGIYGLGRYPTFVHFDIRLPGETDRLIAWQGSRAWAEVKA